MTRTESWFDRLYGQHRRNVLAYCARRAAPADADDAAAEVFAVAWRRRDDIPGGDRELPWLYGVARNILWHQRRSFAAPSAADLACRNGAGATTTASGCGAGAA
jgi:RNA polymerase sigma-70 factor (ECF subfamily)